MKTSPLRQSLQHYMSRPSVVSHASTRATPGQAMSPLCAHRSCPCVCVGQCYAFEHERTCTCCACCMQRLPISDARCPLAFHSNRERVGIWPELVSARRLAFRCRATHRGDALVHGEISRNQLRVRHAGPHASRLAVALDVGVGPDPRRQGAPVVFVLLVVRR